MFYIFYLVLIFSIVIITLQYYQANKGRFLITVSISILFSFTIFIWLQEYDFLFFLIYINFFLYLMTLVSLSKRTKY